MEYIKLKLENYLSQQLILEYGDIYDWFEYESNLAYEIFNDIKNHKKIVFDVLDKNQYHRAAKEIMEYGDIVRFSENKILDWKQLVLENISKLGILNRINGHDNSFDFDTFLDVFNYEYGIFEIDEEDEENQYYEYSKWLNEKYIETEDEKYKKVYDFENVYDFLEEVYNFDETLPTFSNGQPLVSDYGLKPLYDLGQELIDIKNPKEIVIMINRILDVTHQRSDLSELFIEGGRGSLDYISNS